MWSVFGDEHKVDIWPPLIPEPVQPTDTEMNLERLTALWRGEIADNYAEAAVTGTTAIALRLMGRAGDAGEAQAAAEAMWRDRDRAQFPAVA